MALMNKNYTLGKGRLYFDAFAQGTLVTQGERYFGDTMEFNVTSESESLEHFDNDAGIRVKDGSVLLELSRTGTIITENISPENLSLFFLGSAATLTQAALTLQTQNIDPVRKGYYYQIGVSTLKPEGVRKVTNVIVKNFTTPATVYVLGTDYTLDADLGRIQILEAGSVAEADGITIEYDVSAATMTRIVTAADAEIKGALRYIATNPQGEKFDYFFPYVSLKPNGDFALKSGEEWQQLGFQFELLKKDDNTEAMYINGRPA
jgi:hypothetical protein